LPAQIWTQQIFVFAAGFGVHFKQAPALYELSAEVFCRIQLSAYGISRSSVSFAQIQLRARAISGSCAAHKQACRRPRSNLSNDLGQVRIA
jgi:hypothetical protein